MSSGLDHFQNIEKDLRIAVKHLIASDRQIEELQAHKRTVLDSINEGIAIVNPSSQLIYVNRQFNSFFNIRPRGWVGTHLSELQDYLTTNITPQSAQSLNQTLTMVNNGDLHTNAECVVEFNDSPTGPGKMFKIYTSPILSKQNKVLGRLWKFEDISKEREVERIKTEFVSIASHQLRTPVTAIYDYLRLITDGTYGELPETLVNPVNTLVESASHMRDLVNDLLDISRIDSGRIAPKLERVDLVELINKELEEVRSMAKQKQQQLVFLPSTPQVYAMTDPAMVTEMLKNYLHNAIKYTPEFKHIWVRIELDNHHVKVCVKDEGIGIPPEQQNHLFEKFFRASNVLTNNIEGTGLGLYYVKKCAEALNAHLGFHSQMGSGSEFWFSIPKYENII